MTDRKAELESIKAELRKLKKQNKRQQETIDRLKKGNKLQSSEKNSSGDKVSRRGFLKKLGAGAIGLGALSLSPAASTLRITENDVYRDGSPAFLDLSGSYSMNSNLNLSGYRATNLADPANAQDAATRSWTNSNFNNYSDNQARTAVDGSSVSITGNADSVDGYDVQKNGTDGSGIINFKT